MHYIVWLTLTLTKSLQKNKLVKILQCMFCFWTPIIRYLAMEKFCTPHLSSLLFRCKAVGYICWAFSTFSSLQHFCSSITVLSLETQTGSKASPGSTVISSLVLCNEIGQDCVNVSRGGSVLVSFSHHVLTRCDWIKLQAIKAISSLLLIWTSKQQWGILFCFILLPPTVKFLWPAPHNSTWNIKHLLISWIWSSLIYSTAQMSYLLFLKWALRIHQVYPSASLILCWGNMPAIHSETERAAVIAVLSCTQHVTVRGCPVSLVRSWGNQRALTFWPELSVSSLEAFGHWLYSTWLGTGQHFDSCYQFFMHQVHMAAFFLVGLAKANIPVTTTVPYIILYY